jgi:hypothetical protein
MTLATNVPLTVQPDAAQRVAELGLQAELDRMLEHVRQTVPCVQRIDIWLQPPYDTGPDPAVIIEVYQSEPGRWQYSDWEKWRDWLLETFSPDVWRHFAMWPVHDPNHAR